VYKSGKIHLVVDALSRLLGFTKPKGVFDQTIDANLFYSKLEWMKGVKEILKIIQIKGTL
jgi:hypothetical protein